jgi:hypothetical protein
MMNRTNCNQMQKEEKQNGKDFKVLPNGDKYEGELKNGKRTGNGVCHYVDGRKYEGNYRDDKMDGNGVLIFLNGETYQGDFKDDLFDGTGIITYSSGTSRGEFKNGKRHGYFVRNYNDGSKYVGEFKNDVKHGKVIFTDSSGNQFEEYWNFGFLVSKNQLKRDSCLSKDQITKNNKFLGLKHHKEFEFNYIPVEKKSRSNIIQSIENFERTYSEKNNILSKLSEDQKGIEQSIKNKIEENRKNLQFIVDNGFSTNMMEEIEKFKIKLDKLNRDRENNLEKMTEVQKELMELNDVRSGVNKFLNKNNTRVNKCSVCHNKPADIIMAPCGHKIMCKEHAEKFINKPCPICRTKILSFIEKVFE